MAVLSALSTSALAGEAVNASAEFKPNVKCPMMGMVMPIPAEQYKAMRCGHHSKHIHDSNYKSKIADEANTAKDKTEKSIANDVNQPPIPITGSRIIPVEEYSLAATDTSVPAVDLAEQQYKVFFENASAKLREVYHPARYGQYALPADIATLRVGRVKGGFLSNLDLFGNKNKLSIYLLQHKPAMRLYNWYEQRIIGWNDGKAPIDVTVERAINREAQHNFLDTVLVSNETTLDMLKYLDSRLSSKDSDILRAWLIKHKEHFKSDTVIDIVASGLAQQKIDSLYLH